MKIKDLLEKSIREAMGFSSNADPRGGGSRSKKGSFIYFGDNDIDPNDEGGLYDQLQKLGYDFDVDYKFSETGAGGITLNAKMMKDPKVQKLIKDMGIKVQ